MKAMAIVLLLSAGIVTLDRVLPAAHRVLIACADDSGNSDGDDDGDDGQTGT